MHQRITHSYLHLSVFSLLSFIRFVPLSLFLLSLQEWINSQLYPSGELELPPAQIRGINQVIREACHVPTCREHTYIIIYILTYAYVYIYINKEREIYR